MIVFKLGVNLSTPYLMKPEHAQINHIDNRSPEIFPPRVILAQPFGRVLTRSQERMPRHYQTSVVNKYLQRPLHTQLRHLLLFSNISVSLLGSSLDYIVGVNAVHVIVFGDLVSRVHANSSVPYGVRNEVVLVGWVVPFVVGTGFVFRIVDRSQIVLEV